jgi:PST family polysaccharide transporter
LLEYGFNMSATRRLAQLDCATEEAKQLARAGIVADVFGASSVLAGVCLLISLICAFTVPIFEEHRQALVLGAAIALVQGVRPFWYFQGVERLGAISCLNLTGRVFTTLGVFLLVSSPADAMWILWLQLISAGTILLVCLVLMYREVPFVRPAWGHVKNGLREGWSLFITRSAISLYTVANTFVLGWFVPSAQVTMFAGPERLNRAALAVLSPVLGALYPRMATLAAGDQARASRAASLAFAVVTGMGLAVGLVLAVGAPLFIRILGRGYEEAIPVFRVLAALAPLIAVNSMLGSQWMIPLRLDKELNRVILGAGVLNVALAVWVAPRYGPMGMALCAVSAETVVLVGIFATLQRMRKGFWVKQSDT